LEAVTGVQTCALPICTILVYQVGRIGRNALKRAKFLLDHAQANVMGIVLTNVKSEVTPDYGVYRYEYR
jgi:hypothetical protein